ncbi:PqqD family peptide modification chaperone [Streptomyces yaizuensis]|uniref:PqqD family peptide modification chaperone n=1 Tax=Streptomyces yaizuensis TaxID=2989713 RepID=A0ABQ5PA78_9ACTN|nr:PqqD family protein [Streptomyces sp. YSPA8]GLF99452.1 PqqD family peptide modification chaperone [Streptomyces sp. YSPA8]
MRLRRGVHPVLTETAGALLDERSGRWLQLTGTAAVALRLLLDHEERGPAIDGYACRFGVSREVAERDLAGVERTLGDGGLLHRPRQRWGRGWWR